MNDSNTSASKGLLYTLIILFSVSGFVATDIYLPSLPALSTAFNASAGLVQSSVSFFLVGFAISQFVGGISSDRYGRRPVVLLGYVIFILGGVLTVSATSIYTLLFARFMQGLGIGAVAAMARVLVRDVFDGPKLLSALSFLAMVITLAPSIAPAIGGYIQDTVGYQGNFIAMLVYGVILAFIAYRLLPETNLHPKRHATKISVVSANIKQLITNPIFSINVLCNGLAFAVIISYSTVYPFLFQNTLGYSAKMYGVFTLLISSGLVLGMFFNGYLVKHVRPEKIIRCGQYLIIFSGAVLMLTGSLPYPSVPLIVIMTFIAVIGAALILPTTVGLVIAPFPKIAGTVGAVYGAAQVLISAMVGTLLSVMHVTNLMGVASILFLLGLSGLLIRVVYTPKCILSAGIN